MLSESEDNEGATEDEEEASEKSEEADDDPDIILDIPEGPDAASHHQAIKQQREREEHPAPEARQCDGDDEVRVAEEVYAEGEDEHVLDANIVSDTARLI